MRTTLPETGLSDSAASSATQKLTTYPASHTCKQIKLASRGNSGRYPKPVKLGPRTTAWRVSDIRALIEGQPE